MISLQPGTPPPPPPSSGNGARNKRNLSVFSLYRYWWNTRIFPFNKKSYLHRAQWRYYFYLSRVRILVSPWLLKWLANHKRARGLFFWNFIHKMASRCQDDTVTGDFLRWAAKFSHRYFFRAWRTFRKICRRLGKWCWKIHWGGRKCKH